VNKPVREFAMKSIIYCSQ